METRRFDTRTLKGLEDAEAYLEEMQNTCNNVTVEGFGDVVIITTE